MNWPQLMFSDHNNYLGWRNSTYDWKTTRKDLNVDQILYKLTLLSSDFPGEYINKPCVSVKDAQYRTEIICELYSSDTIFKQLVQFNTSLGRFKNNARHYTEIKEASQKQYCFVSLVSQFGKLVLEANHLLRGCSSKGLVDLFKYTEVVLSKYSVVFSQANMLEYDIDQMLNDIVLSTNPSRKTIRIGKKSEQNDYTERLLFLLKEFFGLSINASFSIVDPAPISVLEKNILQIIREKNSTIFSQLDVFLEQNVAIFERMLDFSFYYHQLQFYLTYIVLLKRSADSNIPVCKPHFVETGFYAYNCANPLLVLNHIDSKNTPENIVCNDIKLNKSGMFLLSGPNQGGKTIYLKTLGLTAYLAKCGCFVFCEKCDVPFYDNIYTHFLEAEIMGKGRLIQESERMDVICSQCTTESLILMNESFSSTRRKDGIVISIYYLNQLKDIGCSVGFVSHYYEIPELLNISGKTIDSLRMDISKAGVRTYRVIWNEKGENAYAKDIAIKCGITYEQMMLELRGIV